jgi:hypothetical protein
MRLVIALPLLLVASLARSEAPAPSAFTKLFQLTGLTLLCQQAEPLLSSGLSAAQQATLGDLFAPEPLCLDLAKQLASQFSVAQLQQAQAQLESPLAEQITVAERAVGEQEAELASYSEQLRAHPPRAERLSLVQRLDHAAQTTAMSALLRYEVGKTQALLALKAQGGSIDEATLSAKTTVQRDALRASSEHAVQTFMLFAYRQTPSTQLTAYAMLYEQEPLQGLLDASVVALPKVFAARRAALK